MLEETKTGTSTQLPNLTIICHKLKLIHINQHTCNTRILISPTPTLTPILKPITHLELNKELSTPIGLNTNRKMNK